MLLDVIQDGMVIIPLFFFCDTCGWVICLVGKFYFCYVEYVLLDFVMGKGCTECSKAICEDAFGKHPTFADMMRHPWFKHLMSHPVATEPYSPLPPIVRNDAYYWHSFHFPLFYYLQEGNSLAHIS